MSAPSNTDYQFVLCCLKHSQGKPDFHAVAKELGLKTHMTAYHRHWNIMKKAGMAGNTGRGRKPGTGTAAVGGTSGGGKKRGRPKKISRKTHEEESEEEEDEENKVKYEPKDESGGETESPAKKVVVETEAGSYKSSIVSRGSEAIIAGPVKKGMKPTRSS